MRLKVFFIVLALFLVISAPSRGSYGVPYEILECKNAPKVVWSGDPETDFALAAEYIKEIRVAHIDCQEKLRKVKLFLIRGNL